MAGVSAGAVREYAKQVEQFRTDMGKLVMRQDNLDQFCVGVSAFFNRGFWGRLRWLLKGE